MFSPGDAMLSGGRGQSIDMAVRGKWTVLGGKVPTAPGQSPAVRDMTINDIDVVFQPIVKLANNSEIGVEAFVRCRTPQYAAPQALFAQAVYEQAAGHLGRVIREVTFQRAPDSTVFINVHAEELSARWLVRPDDPICYHDRGVFLEVGAETVLLHSELCRSVLTEVCTRIGEQLVIDDFGRGNATVDNVLALRPKAIKLDESVVRSIDSQPSKHAMVNATVQRCENDDVWVIAECVETIAELRTLQALGVGYAQGHIFARPAFPIRAADPPQEAADPRGLQSTAVQPSTFGDGPSRSGRTLLGAAPPSNESNAPGNVSGGTPLGRRSPSVSPTTETAPPTGPPNFK